VAGADLPHGARGAAWYCGMVLQGSGWGVAEKVTRLFKYANR
jgi:hypothetical protein